MPDSIREITVEPWGVLVIPQSHVVGVREIKVETSGVLVIYPDQTPGAALSRIIKTAKSRAQITAEPAS